MNGLARNAKGHWVATHMDSALLKQSYSRELAAQVLGIHVGELNEWLLSGVLRGQEITPPRPDNRRGAGKISGYELAIVQERMKAD